MLTAEHQNPGIKQLLPDIPVPHQHHLPVPLPLHLLVLLLGRVPLPTSLSSLPLSAQAAVTTGDISYTKLKMEILYPPSLEKEKRPVDDGIV